MLPNLDDHSSELIIGLVCTVGTESKEITDLLTEQLGRAGYETEVIKISGNVIPDLHEVKDIRNNHGERIKHLMDCGNAIRKKFNDNAILAMGAIERIAKRRVSTSNGDLEPLEKKAFIIDSLKRPEEVEALRAVYPSGFVLIAVHCDMAIREHRLCNTLQIRPEDAKSLMERDINEAFEEYGQRVNDTFHLADFFVRINSNKVQLRNDIQRMVELWFGSPVITPTFDEYAMFMAFSAALRSADLSRQVGAVIARGSQILSTGANDCPAPAGGLYWPTRSKETGKVDDVERGRDHTRGIDSNKAEQLRLISQIMSDARNSNVRFKKIQLEHLQKLLEKSAIRDLTEYGRVVHAEMEAILSCARVGVSTVGSTLYCTTFPCHNCAKHIIASGVMKVVYVEPYPKSKALEFHDDAIVHEKPIEESDSNKQEIVLFEPFVGIGPRRFFDLFSMKLSSSYEVVRKESSTGRKTEWNISEAKLRIRFWQNSYLEMEADTLRQFRSLKSRHSTPQRIS